MDARTMKWHLRHLDHARYASQHSKDPSTGVGARIVDEHQRVVSEAYNGFPRGVSDTLARLNDRTVKYKIVLHAEENAILFAQRPLYNCTLYVWPCPPCAHCAALIIQSGLARVVSVQPTADMLSRWRDDLKLAADIFAEAQVGTLFMSPEIT